MTLLQKQWCWFIYVFILPVEKVLPERTTACIIGDSIILHCLSSDTTLRSSTINAFWRYEDSKTVFDIMRSRVSLEEQDAVYRGRVDSFPEEYTKGNFSIRLRDVKLSDAGMYSCFIPHVSEQTIVELIVKGLLLWCGAAESFTDKMVDLGQNVTLRCEVAIRDVYWYLMKPSHPPVFILRSFSNNQNQTCECKQFQDETHDEDEEMRLWRNLLITSGLLICVLVIVVTGMTVSHCKVSPNHLLQPPNSRLQKHDALSAVQNQFPVLLQTEVQTNYKSNTFILVEFNQFNPVLSLNDWYLAHFKAISSPLLDPLQFAYRANKSVDVVNLSKDLDNPVTYARVLFMNFSSAFNTIVPELLKAKPFEELSHLTS
ncbi:hypothetical protein P4O66_004430 [Electrophorus voltai]|uniref:Ig-like domain-containing protein n=1 Tax=Electrophorus voltai TaxID=2609070 RepID=A0AAD8ZMZ3_9TELE|nr:hypothetical protein P4O66_004430 [Electrophorus voltai]